MRLKVFTQLSFIALVISTTACSQKQLYQNIQDNQKQECKKLPMSEQADCLEQHQQPFDEYKKQREGAAE